MSKNVAPTHQSWQNSIHLSLQLWYARSPVFFDKGSATILFLSAWLTIPKKKLNEQPAAAEVNNNNKKIVSAETH